jgi:hypothetical protein
MAAPVTPEAKKKQVAAWRFVGSKGRVGVSPFTPQLRFMSVP